jgi:hypothetical protein
MALFSRYGSQGQPPPPVVCPPADDTDPGPVRRALVHRLAALGIHRELVPGLIRNIAVAHRIDPYIDRLRFNRRLRYLGWNDLNLDYHTWQLALACLETEDGRQRIQ